jgi:uncharacterized membrane protein YGL010W
MMSTIADSAEAAASPRKVDQLMALYGESHQNPRNEQIHYVAVPLILLSLLGLLSAVHPWIAYGFVAASMVYYARLSLVFMVAMAVISGTALVLVRAMGSWVLPLSAAIFVAAWIAQFIGHKIEGKKPSFFDDLRFLWVSPLYLLSKPFARLGIRW